MKFERLPLWIQKAAVLWALLVFVLSYRFSRKFREEVMRSLNQIRNYVPALFKQSEEATQ